MRKMIYLFSFLIFSAQVECLDRIGKVLAIEGVLKAIQLDQAERFLTRHADIFLGDTLITDEMSKGQIQFFDGTSVLLIPGSQYSVDEYAASNFWGKNRYTARLHQGGVQISTGLIGRKSPENFLVGTPDATIGVRGTVFQARLTNGTLYAGSSSGKINVQNGAGNVTVGPELSHSYALASSWNMPPEELNEMPAVLNPIYFEGPAPKAIFHPTTTGSVPPTKLISPNFSIGPCILSIAVIGTIVGVVTASASSSNKTPTFPPVSRNLSPPPG